MFTKINFNILQRVQNIHRQQVGMITNRITEKICVGALCTQVFHNSMGPMSRHTLASM